jgi:hypothetical protein
MGDSEYGMDRRWLGLLGGMLLVAVVVGGCSSEERQTGRVQVLENGAVLGELDRQPAVRDVSRRVGFAVQLPTYVPSNRLRLASIEALVPLSGIEAIGSDGRSNATSITTWVSGGQPLLRLQQFDRRVEPGPDLERATAGEGSTELYVNRVGGDILEAAWLLADRSFVAYLPAGSGISGQDLERMFRSLR